MSYRIASLALSAWMLGASAPPGNPPAGTDSHVAELTEAAYTFNCANIRAHISFEEHRRDPDSVPLADAWRIVLTRFEVEGRRIAPADRRRIERAFHRYSWLTRLKASCSGWDNAFELWIEGMDAGEWAAAVSPWRGQRPQTRVTSVRVTEDGTVTIS